MLHYSVTLLRVHLNRFLLLFPADYRVKSGLLCLQHEMPPSGLDLRLNKEKHFK